MMRLQDVGNKLQHSHLNFKVHDMYFSKKESKRDR